ncbi:hypothetical protein PTSG_00789 [Salpingoeca rosetta]|uniref:FAD dependent oxidoreductase n=1 Tax=Salpingoeca rosetta (strain ATCC 50818 / BSB-021) TaxID=946362 RepID=F2TXH3_SALR5|nr:uncharacterized protein PTSG_00789 [Salpingoeca rosetta]EGD76082.1 hypothetical protein PTSG_00789 [Salpingoeca rosetta]|eukprot:XP_004998257.1 hypothetical protein PTSG_00789 [Salpingoeca rosetta]
MTAKSVLLTAAAVAVLAGVCLLGSLSVRVQATLVAVQQHQVVHADVAVYGSTPGGIMAAVAASRGGANVTLVSATTLIGGMCSSGLGKTDKGDPSVIGGLAHEFFGRVGARYNSTEPVYDFEPHVAEATFHDMLADANVTLVLNQHVTRLVKRDDDPTVIHALQFDQDLTVIAKRFIDASYEGDLLPLANVSFTIGREGQQQYNESLAGFRGRAMGHEFGVAVDPFDAHGNLLPLVSPQPKEKVGDGDGRVQSYNFRLCVTQDKTNRVPFAKPPNYNASAWELARRLFTAAVPPASRLPSGNLGPLPNGKFDMNNDGPISTDFIGGSQDWPTATPKQREIIWQAHKEYTQGLLWFLSQDPALNESVHDAMRNWGLCKDEFEAYDHWPPILYVREGRRMQGDLVFTQSLVERQREHDIGAASIGMGSYNYDMHNAQRYACTNKTACTAFSLPYAWNEGDVEQNPGYHYQIPYGALLPRKSQATNLLVPVAVSASHVGYGTLRMEPQFMIMGQAAGTAAAIGIQVAIPAPVQDINVKTLSKELKAAGQIVTQAPPTPEPHANCTFQDSVDYDHAPWSWPTTSRSQCCGMCAAYDGCVAAVFRYAGSPKNTCWPVLQGHKHKQPHPRTQGIVSCLLQHEN